MYDIAIIGGSLSGLISAIELSKNNKICIIDINQEIGFPTNFPGLVKDVELIKRILVTEELDNLYLNQSKIGWAMRSEWLIKYLTQLCAKKGVEILNRTRVSNIFYDDLFNIEIIGGGPNNNIIKSKIIIDETEQIHAGPGDKNHKIPIDNKKIILLKTNNQQYFSGIIPTDNIDNFPENLFQISRSDGLTEVWFNEQQKEHVNWIEIKKCNSPSKQNLMIIDDYFSRANEINLLSLKLLT